MKSRSRNRPNATQSGFTLVELLIVIAIVGILSAIAIPAYRDHVLRGKIADATAALSEYRIRMEQYYQDNRRYSVNADGSGGCGVPAPTAKHFSFTDVPCANATSQQYLATATGISAQGMTGFTYTINQANVRATTNVPSGWGPTNTACWVVKTGGQC